MWTPTTCAQHSREGLHFASDLTDVEWAVLEPLLLPPAGMANARDRQCDLLHPARRLPLAHAAPPRQTVYGWFASFRDRGVWQRLNHRLVMLDRERAGREASPSAAVIDSQSVKATEAGGHAAMMQARR
jgi:transposase